jgi:hypothetical protein
MARASNVYVVIPKGCMTPLAGFTVKHELYSWLDGQAVKHKVYRIRDNRYAERVVTDITEECYE